MFALLGEPGDTSPLERMRHVVIAGVLTRDFGEGTVDMGAGFKPLDVVESLDKFQRSSHRALLLDWGGTLTPAGATS